MLKHVSVIEAHALMDQGSVYVDVRSTEEFAQGHPAGALNVPLLERDEAAGQILPNPDFLRVMQANFPPETRLLIGCQVGNRSVRAGQILESFGFTDVSNVKGGFVGMRDPLGRPVDPGWVECGLPAETEAPAGHRYADLVAHADRP